MASGKSLELRYGASKTYKRIQHKGDSYRNPARVQRKNEQLLDRRDAKARARANGKR